MKEIKKAFTLAEVLITLGVIGVVAVMTMSVIIKNIQHKTLESQFKKSYSQLSQVLEQARMEFGILETTDYDDIREYISNKYNKGKVIDNFETSYINSFLTYSKLSAGKGIRANCFDKVNTINKRFINSDGSFMAICLHNYYGIMISVDTNGYKGPNRFGYDLFFFRLVNSKLSYFIDINRNCTETENCPNYGYITEGSPCSKSSTKLTNGISCVRYALTNTCPDDANKKYWECLP
ncbi:type II secretion system protein [bacterium]|nr:type II secretion system protein [bacterium]